MKSTLFSINDIAKALGVSASTVSRALKNHPDISRETREKIQAYAKKVNYRPNALAISLKQQRSYTIGLIIPEIQHHFFSSIISGVEGFAYANGFRVMICQSNEDYTREIINTQALLDHRVDGILVSLGKNTHHFDHFQNLIDHGLPIVFFDRVCEALKTDRLVTDDAEGAKSVTRYMIETGRRNILHLSAPQHLLIGRERCRGYCEALQEHGIAIRENLIL
ncbi:MAG: LacI family DNA-binding transcriptional regulator, partial [Bacteroidales bacterium]|nr:LacI family DNA-binding transcriptional regulator [Bacteroidales bacterium]